MEESEGDRDQAEQQRRSHNHHRSPEHWGSILPLTGSKPLPIFQMLQLVCHFENIYSSVLKKTNTSILGFKKGNFGSHLKLRSRNKSIFSMQDLKCQESN